MNGFFTHILHKIVNNIHGESTKWHWVIFDGDVDNVAIIEELKKRHYSGFVSLEYFGKEGFPYLRKSLEQWKDYMGVDTLV